MSESHQMSRIISLDSGINFRDLGGYRGAGGKSTRWRSVFRSGMVPSSDTDEARLSELGIRAVIDLRSNAERKAQPHGLSQRPDVAYRSHDHDHDGGSLMKMLRGPDLGKGDLRSAMIKLYRNLPYTFAALYRELLLAVAFGPLPLVFNCAAGKDRTGVGASLLLSALGVGWDQIVADYLMTQQFLPDILRAFASSGRAAILESVDATEIRALFGVDRAYLDAMREAIDMRSNSMENYLSSQLQLDPPVLNALRQRMLA